MASPVVTEMGVATHKLAMKQMKRAAFKEHGVSFALKFDEVCRQGIPYNARDLRKRGSEVINYLRQEQDILVHLVAAPYFKVRDVEAKLHTASEVIGDLEGETDDAELNGMTRREAIDLCRRVVPLGTRPSTGFRFLSEAAAALMDMPYFYKLEAESAHARTEVRGVVDKARKAERLKVLKKEEAKQLRESIVDVSTTALARR